MALCYYNFGDIHQSVKLFEDCKDIFTKIDNNHIDLSTLYSNLSLAYISSDRYRDAIDSLEKGLELNLRLHKNYYVSMNYTQIAWIEYHRYII